jgi:hypothetical protein
MAQRAERREHVYRKASSGGLDQGRAARWGLARIIRESIKYKGLERDRKALPQAFSVTQEAFAWMKIAYDTLLFFPTLAPLGGDELLTCPQSECRG